MSSQDRTAAGASLPRPIAIPVLLSKTTLVEMLRTCGLRPTRQRLAICQLIFGGGPRHMTAEELYGEARLSNLNFSPATIYNNLHHFEQAKLLREVAAYGGKTWYDTAIGPHFHYYDVESEYLFDIPDGAMPTIQIPAMTEGMVLIGVDIVVRVKSIRQS